MVGMTIILLALAMFMVAGCCGSVEESKSCTFTETVSVSGDTITDSGPVNVTCECQNGSSGGFPCPGTVWRCKSLINGCDHEQGGCDPGVSGALASAAGDVCRHKGLGDESSYTYPGPSSPSKLCLNNLD